MDLYHRLQTIDRERSQLQASTKPDTHAIKQLEDEREAIFQWVRATIGDPGAVAVVKAGPSREELMALFELATIGDILGLQARAMRLEQLDPQWRPFARRLGRFTSRFEPAQALALIARYLQPE